MEISENAPKIEQPSQKTLNQICDESVRLTKGHINADKTERSNMFVLPKGKMVKVITQTEMGEIVHPGDYLVGVRIDDDIKSAQEKGGTFFQIYKNKTGEKYIEKHPAVPLVDTSELPNENMSIEQINRMITELQNRALDAMNVQRKRRESGETRMGETEAQDLLVLLKGISKK